MEEIEDRFGDRMEEILEVVRSSLTGTNPLFLPSEGDYEKQGSPTRAERTHVPETRLGWEEGEDVRVEDEFDDTGAGAGVEGDLEMGDENDD